MHSSDVLVQTNGACALCDGETRIGATKSHCVMLRVFICSCPSVIATRCGYARGIRPDNDAPDMPLPDRHAMPAQPRIKNNKRSPGAGAMLGQCHRRWTSIERALGERFVFLDFWGQNELAKNLSLTV